MFPNNKRPLFSGVCPDSGNLPYLDDLLNVITVSSG